ncbi:MAG TPA: YcjX family protein [Campylobacteraceae bacterium]|nr:YcjX family protein [Campylobacteraceae bacterium]
MLSFIKEFELPFKIPTPDKTIKVAVTGLSRSGKTVFLTSLINQLIANDKLPYLNEKLGRPFVARLLPPDSVYVRFDYYSKIKAFRLKEPKWPKATKSVSKTTLQLEFKSEYALLQNQIVNLELIDYPGEWLLDLSMLELDFSAWSQKMLALSKVGKRKRYAAEWHAYLSRLDIYASAPDAEHEEEVLHDHYSEYLKSLHYRGYSFVQPGRFLEPGDMQDDPLLRFCPLPTPTGEVDPDSIYARFEKRYEKYISEVVKRLYLEHFESFDTQIVLVDLLKTLEHGYDIFEDMHLSFKHILKSFTYGSNSFLSRLFRVHINQVIFAATKADYLPRSEHNRYKKLLEEMIGDLKKELDVHHIDTEVTVIAAVRSTEDVRAKINGKEVTCVRGIVEGEKAPSTHFPGRLPESYHEDNFLKKEDFHVTRFRPLSFPPRDTKAVEHIRMDKLIYSILKDRV